MNAAAVHRGPDGTGVLCTGSVGLGHTRLSIIDVGERSNQPMTRHRRHIVFNGEIYNYIELRRELERRGHIFTTSSDTEVLLIALLEWGQAALDRLSGMFAFVYFDEVSGQVWAVRDRFGIKPLVHARVGNVVLFASEPKQILATEFLPPVLNRETAFSYLAKGTLNTDAATFFKGIEEIRPGEIVVVDLAVGVVRSSTWYSLAERIRPSRMSYGAATEEVRARLKTSIMRHHRSDVPLGACLSGGIDSSAIVMLSRTLFPDQKLTTISTFSRNFGYDERQFSRRVADASDVTSVEIEVDTQRVWDPDFLEEFGYYHDQPLLGGSHYNEYLVFKAARENGLKVMLDGQGSDEYFGGYGEFWFSAQIELLRAGRIKCFLEGMSGNAASTGRSLANEVLMFCRTLLNANKGGPPAIGPMGEPWLRSKVEQTRVGFRDFRQLSLSQIATTSIPYQLHSEDRNSMRWSVESRVPFLDHDLVEFVINLPTEFKVGKGYRKRILRDAVPELPRLISQRKDKIGFASPDSIALRSKAKVVHEYLRSATRELSDFVDGDVIIRAFEAMMIRHHWYDPVFLRVIALDAWRRAFRAEV
jgi:asparagine synthase (glutamine-hydrolysing)